MQVLVICLGLLSCICVSECTITGWTTPALSTADGNAGIVYLNEGATTYTVAAIFGASASAATYEIPTQTVTTFFAIDNSGALTLSGANVLDGDATTLAHELTIKVVDDTTGTALSGTVTVTFSILAGRFSSEDGCVYVGPNLAIGDAVTTVGMTSGGTNVITIDSGDTNTDFTIATGAITTAKALTPASGTSGSFTLVLKGVENIGTPSTVSTSVNICITGSTCTCTSANSAAVHITAGFVGIFAALLMMLLK